ncbi:peptidase M23 [Pasteurellaceae bacterium RH1A]|nr:peptidase M23 [Pasteurellaceae bacterium RH1A]
MQKIVFARDRRKKKARIKLILFFLALCSLGVGILLVLQDHQKANSRSPFPQDFTFTIDEIEENPLFDSIDFAKAIAEQALQLAQEGEQADGFSGDDGDALAHSDDPAAGSDQQHDDVISADGDEDAIADNAHPDLTPEAKNVLEELLEIASQAQRIKNQFSHTVARGDKLKDVLEHSGLDNRVAQGLIKQSPGLANLAVGQQFYWTLDANGELDYLNWLVSEKEEQIFQRTGKNQYTRKIIAKKGEWKQDVVKGTIQNGLANSLKAIGLSQRQINSLISGLQWQIATNKLKKGDKFAVLVRREYINGKVTELGNVEAIHVVSGGKSYYAILADNGRFYNRHGETLGKGFARIPLLGGARVSSHFNPRRVHPITRRLRPHKGVDFAVKIGTPIIAPADGKVVAVSYQARGAGRYIKLQHGSQYATVYMHLSRSLVKVGQQVKKGQRIALSGNTGGSTGPHLHYEFHINGYPVNPMTVKLPGTGASMPDKERKAFLAKAKNIEARLKL